MGFRGLTHLFNDAITFAFIEKSFQQENLTKGFAVILII